MAVSATSSGQLSVRAEDVQSAASNDQLPELHQDIVKVIFTKCISMGNLRTITALLCVNKYWNQFMVSFISENLEDVCPELTIMDAKTQQRECSDEPKIDEFKIFKAVKKVAPHVEDNAGVTLLTMIKGDTLNKLMAIATQAGIQVEITWDAIAQDLGNIPIEQTYTILITNSVFIHSRNKNYDLQNTIVEGHGCKMPEGQEYVALCVFAQKVFKKCLYKRNGQNILTYGSSSTHVRDNPLVIGGSAPGRLYVGHNVFGHERYGAGGQWKF